MRNTNPIFEGIEFAPGLDNISAVTQKVKQDFSTALKNGLARGERTVTNYKRTNPLITRGRNLKFYHKYDSYHDFLDKINDKDLEVFIKWVNKIEFKVIFGNPHKSENLRSIIQHIFEETYIVQGSSIMIEGKAIILNLSFSIPKQEMKLDENIVVGVNLGINTPAMCSLNNNIYERLAIGSKDDFLRVRTKIQAQRKRIQKSLKNTSGGHGRGKKLKKLDTIKKSEVHFVETYCHMISRRIVDFAIKHNAKYINLEDLTGFDKDEFILRNWSYYKIEQYTTYKAEKHGIIVRKVVPSYNGQICSICGHWNNAPRKFNYTCTNPECKSHDVYEYGFNDDFNTSRNVAMSTLFTNKSKKTVEEKLQEARQYYGIEEEYQKLKDKSEKADED